MLRRLPAPRVFLQAGRSAAPRAPRRLHGVGMEFDPMKLPWWKIAAAGGIACVALVGIVSLWESSKPISTVADVAAPVVTMEGEASSPWNQTKELDDETAGIDPDTMLPTKLRPIGPASDLEFAAAPIPQVKDEPAAELTNPSREELLLHIARNARKRKDYDESAKFYRRIVELQRDRAELQFEYAEMLAEAGKNIELKEVVEKIERRSKPKDDAGRKKLAALKEQVGRKSTPLPTAPVPPSSVKMHAADYDGWSKSGQDSIPKQITEAPKPATVISPPMTFDSLDPPMIPTPPTVGDTSKKNSGPPDDLKPPEPDHHPSNDDYRQLLTADPNHARPLESQPFDAKSAFDVGRMDSQFHATLDGDYFRQRGRDGLTDIDRFRLQGWLSMNVGDEDGLIAVGEGWLHNSLRNAPDVDGNVISVRGQYKPFDRLFVHAQLNGETYDARFRDRLTYDLGASWRSSGRLRVYGNLFGNNVAENAESIRQDIHRHGVMVGVDFSPNPCDDFGGFYRFADYSDDNQLNEFDLYASRRLSHWPDELKLIGDIHYWSYDSGTAFALGLPFDAPPLYGTAHPYFAPGGYSLFSGHLEWKKALSSDVFAESDLTWIGLRGGGGVDSDGVAFAFGRAIFHRDFFYWLSFHSELGVTESRVYRDLSAFAYLTARLRK
jgi:hypothetical protein